MMNTRRRLNSAAGASLAAWALAQRSAWAADELRDVRPPVDLPGFPVWLLLAAVLFAAGLFFIFFFRRRWKNRPETPLPVRSPKDIALQQLDELSDWPLGSREQIKAYYYELSMVLRRYIEAQLDLHAPEMTTPEFLQALPSSGRMTPAQKNHLEEFLMFSDQVKFAKFSAGEDQCRESLVSVRQFVLETSPAGAVSPND